MKKTLRVCSIALKYLLLLMVLAAVVFPLLYIFLAAFKSNSEILVSGANIWPEKFLLDNFRDAWQVANFSSYTFNTIYMTFFIVAGSVLTCTVMSYVFARGNFAGKKLIYGVMMSSLFISLGTAAIFPQLQIAKGLGLSHSLWGVILIRILGLNVPNIFIGIGYLYSISKEIDDAAKIDGCGFFRIYWNIILPLLKPLIATIGLLTFRMAWNGYMLPMVFTLSRPDQVPLIVGIVNLRSTGAAASSYNLMIAGATIAMVPMLAVYFLLNKWFIAGLTNGAVKG